MLIIRCKDCKEIVKEISLNGTYLNQLHPSGLFLDIDTKNAEKVKSIIAKNVGFRGITHKGRSVDIHLSDIERRHFASGREIILDIFNCGEHITEPEETMSNKDNLYVCGEVYCVVGYEKPTIKEMEETGSLGKVVIPFHTVLASSEGDAINKVLTANKLPEDVNQDRLEIVAKPF